MREISSGLFLAKKGIEVSSRVLSESNTRIKLLLLVIHHPSLSVQEMNSISFTAAFLLCVLCAKTTVLVSKDDSPQKVLNLLS